MLSIICTYFTGYATSGFGATSAGCTAIKFNPVTDTDTRVINGVVHKINTSHQSITVMKEYETKAFEELRFEYYLANSKVEQQVTRKQKKKLTSFFSFIMYNKYLKLQLLFYYYF